MPREEPEIVLARQLANALTVPMFLVDTEGTLLFYNKPAEVVLGRRFEQTGEMSAAVWSRIFFPVDESGNPLEPGTLPLVVAVNEHRPSHGRLWISGIDNVRRHIEVVALPLIGQSDRNLGAIAIFWEVGGS